MIAEFSLAGKTALITGAARGIGTGIAEVFAEAGATVVVNSLTHRHLDGFTASLPAAQRAARRSDRRRRDQSGLGRRYQWPAASPLPGRSTSSSNNLGDSIRRPLVPSKEGNPGFPIEEIQTILSLNLLATIYCSRAVGKHMIERRSGKVVNISSFGALQGAAGNSLYAAAKAGLTGLTRSLALEWAPYRRERQCRRARDLSRCRHVGAAGL